MRVGYFSSAGHTELGARMLSTGEREIAAIDAFLRKIAPEVIQFERLFPAREKPGPKHKPGRPPASFKDQNASGVTGRGLLDIMKERLTKYYRGKECGYGAILLIDDADCRFLQENDFWQWREDMQKKITEWTENSGAVFFALLAFPEVEAWLLADWDEGFGREYAGIAVTLRRELAKEGLLGPTPWDEIERFGGPFDSERGSCTRKLSDEINAALGRLAQNAGIDVERKMYTYSKRDNGPDMLRRIRPEQVAQVCRRFFQAEIHALESMARLAPPAT